MFLDETPCHRIYSKRQRKTEVTSQNQAQNVECKDPESKRKAWQFEKGLSEVRLKGQGKISSGDYTVYYSGGEGAERCKVKVVQTSVDRSAVNKIMCNDRIIALKIKAEPVCILLVQVYMPTSEYKYEELEAPYNIINEIL